MQVKDQSSGYATTAGHMMVKAAVSSLVDQHYGDKSALDDIDILSRMVEMFDKEYDAGPDNIYDRGDQLTTNEEGYYTLAYDPGKSPNTITKDGTQDPQIRAEAQAFANEYVRGTSWRVNKPATDRQKHNRERQQEAANQRWYASLAKAMAKEMMRS